MATEGRGNAIDLIARLVAAPFHFGFFQAVRVLRLAEAQAGTQGTPPRGLRFRTPLSLRFPPSELLRFDARELEVGFLGLTGPSGVLPHPYTELLMERASAHRDGAAHAFLDLFSHRAIALFYEAWQKYRFYVGYEAGTRAGFTQHLLDLLGTGRPDPRDRTGRVPFQLLAHFSGLLGRRPLPASSLMSLLRTYFGVPILLEQFAGQWLVAPRADQSGLGLPNSELGVTTVLGARVWDPQTKIRLRIGPLGSTEFSAFQPEGSATAALRELLGICFGETLSCDLTLILRRENLPEPILDTRATAPPRLGLDTWARTRPPRNDLDDARFRLT